MRRPPAEEPACGRRFPAAFRRTGIRLLGHRSPAEELGLPHGRLTGPTGPDLNGIVMLHMSKTRPGRTPPLPRGRWCAPDRRLLSSRHPPLHCGQSLRPRWHFPSAGVTFTRHQRRFTQFAHHPGRPHHRRGPGSNSPPVFSSPVTPGWNGRPWASSSKLRTPQLPATHVEAETGHRALARVLHPRHQSNLQTVPPT